MTGRLRRGYGRLVTGIGLVGAAVWLGAPSAPEIVRWSQLMAYRIVPDRWLIADLERSAAAGSAFPASGAELGRRIERGRIDEQEADQVVAAIAPLFRGMSSYGGTMYDEIESDLRSFAADPNERRTWFDAWTRQLLADPAGCYSTYQEVLAEVLTDERHLAADRNTLTDIVIARAAAAAGGTPPQYCTGGGHLHEAWHRHAATGGVTDEQFRRYLDAALEPSLVGPEGVLSAGDTVRFEVALAPSPWIIGTRAAMFIEPTGDSATWPMAGHVSPAVPRHEPFSYHTYGDGFIDSIWAWVTLPREPGRYTLRADFVARVYELEEHGSWGIPGTSYPDPIRMGDLAAPRIELRIPIEREVIVGPARGEPITFEPKSMPAEYPIRRESDEHRCWIWLAGDASLAHVSLAYAPPDQTIAGLLELVQDGISHPIGWVYMPIGREVEVEVSAPVRGLKAGPCTLRVVPAPGILDRPVGIGDVADYPLEFESKVWQPGLRPWELDGTYHDWEF